ncbi:hypothetical protein N7447_001352 [Penicillium robsamsonii]|uniref:uncharacterized protein n=1 Tax=Penicillium robsamsonii TaxID=1792511 RepID=UPI0025495CED|nr:uncharacterized protein N7447_001352 [Penicillium robsamsonii]KAJ5835326.1 hypothetical protein N7447_001352 [Penicillium robsamsonii]
MHQITDAPKKLRKSFVERARWNHEIRNSNERNGFVLEDLLRRLSWQEQTKQVYNGIDYSRKASPYGISRKPAGE